MDPIWNQRSSINRDFLVLSAVIIFIALLTSLWVAYDAFSTEAKRIAAQLETETTRVDNVFESEIQRASYILESVGRQIIQRGTDDKNQIAQMLRAFDSNNEYYSVFLWVNNNLHAVTSSRQGVLDVPIDLSDRTYITKSEQEPFRIQIGEPATGRVSERLIVPMAMGLTDHTGRYIGSVTLSIDLEKLTLYIRDHIHKPQIGFTIFNDGFALLAHDQNNHKPLNSPAWKSRVDAESLQNRQSGFLHIPTLFSPNQLFTFFQKSKHHGYVILTSYANDHSTLKALILPRMIQLMLVAAFLVSLLWLVRFRVIRPVQTLAAASAEITRGNEKITVPKSGPLEITQLSHHLQKMLDYLIERKRIEAELIAKVLRMKTAKETAEVGDQAKMQILRLLKPEIFPAVEDIGEICSLLVETSEKSRNAGNSTMLKEQLEHASNHLQDVVKEIFNLPVLSENHQLLNRRPVDVGQLVHQCVSMLEDSLEREEVNVSLRFQEDLPKLNVNELHLMHVVMHLLLSCAGAIPAGGELIIEATLEATSRGNEFALIFNDNASGMDTQRIASLWRAGLPHTAQIAQSVKPNPYTDQENIDAMMLTKKIITLHNGRMTVQNPPDKEAVITVYFQQ